MSPPPSAAGPPASGEESPAPPESHVTRLPWHGLDRLGFTQATGGLALGLIALFSSYDHITFAGRSIPIPQQWGIPLIAASVATVFVDAQLASGSRLRAAQAATQLADETARERNLASEERQRANQERLRANQERDRADQERDRAAETRERQAEVAERQDAALDLLRRSAVPSARVQLDPSDTNRGRLQTFLALIADQNPPEAEIGR